MLLALSTVLGLLGAGFSFKLKQDREKLRPFECGFTPKACARLPFSIRFFLVTIIFLVFDVELILIFPAIPALYTSHVITRYSIFILIILILILGLSHEIIQGNLSWANL